MPAENLGAHRTGHSGIMGRREVSPRLHEGLEKDSFSLGELIASSLAFLAVAPNTPFLTQQPTPNYGREAATPDLGFNAGIFKKNKAAEQPINITTAATIARFLC